MAPASAAGIGVDLSVADTTGLPDDVVALVRRVAQETVRNAVRHGSPAHLSVHLTTPPGRTVLEVADDGVRFDPALAPQQGHLGLRALRDLVQDSGGTLEVTSSPDCGTRARLELPTP